MVEGQPKYPKNLNAQNKEEESVVSERESVVSLRLAKMQYEIFSSMLYS